MISKRTPDGPRAVGLRSAVTNKTRLFLGKGGDLSVVGRRLRDIRDDIAAELGAATSAYPGHTGRPLYLSS